MKIKRCVDNKILKLKQDKLDNERKTNAQLKGEIIKLKQEIENLNLHSLSMLNGSIDMTISGKSSKLFMTTLVEIFKQNGAQNFLTITVLDGENNKYALSIENCNGKLTPAEKIEQLEQENKSLRLLVEMWYY